MSSSKTASSRRRRGVQSTPDAAATTASTEPQETTLAPEGPAATPTPAPDTPVDPFANVMNETIAKLDGDITHFEGLLAQLKAQRDEVEAEHAQRAASSPLALRLEVVGCQWATEVFAQGAHASNIPQFTWGLIRCPFGKTQPDQDCRDCIHHKIIPIGQEHGANDRQDDKAYARRYPQYGTIVPLTDADAEALSHYLIALGRPALRRVDSEISAVEVTLERVREARVAEARRALYEQQGGR